MPERTVLEKGARREQILDAAIQVFAKKGFQSTSVSDVIEAAGIARGTFYLYFKSKTEVFRAILDKYLHDLKENAERETRRDYSLPNLRKTVRESLLDHLRYYAANRDLAAIVLREAMALDPSFQDKCLEVCKAMQGHWAASVERLKRLGVVKADVNSEVLNLLFTGVVLQVVIQWILPNPRINLEKVVDDYMHILENGVLKKPFSFF